MKPEILPGPERRRRWSAEEKARIVAETLMPGAKVSDVARRHRISRGLLYGWRRERGQGAAHAVPPDLVPVVITEEAVPSAQTRIASGSRNGSIEIGLPSGIRVMVHGKVDAQALRAVLTALRSA